MTTMYFFEIGTDLSADVAIYTKTMVRTDDPDLDQTLSDMMAGNFAGWLPFNRHQDPNMNGNLDIALEDTDVSVTIIFSLPGHSTTHFEKSKPLETLRIPGLKGGNGAKVIRQGKTYPANEQAPRWASVVFDRKACWKEINDNHSDCEADGHALARFPFTFNFIDDVTGVSPMLKRWHEHSDRCHDHDHPHTKRQETHGGIHPDKSDLNNRLLTHGGIHPDSPANAILVIN